LAESVNAHTRAVVEDDELAVVGAGHELDVRVLSGCLELRGDASDAGDVVERARGITRICDGAQQAAGEVEWVVVAWAAVWGAAVWVYQASEWECRAKKFGFWITRRKSLRGRSFAAER